MSSGAYPWRGLSKRLSVLTDIGRIWTALSEVPPPAPEDPTTVGYRRVLEARVVRDLLGTPGILDQVVRQTDAFRKEFARYDLGSSEGYLISVVGEGTPVRKLLLVSTLGRFATLLNLARLREKGVLVFTEPISRDADSTFSRRRPS